MLEFAYATGMRVTEIISLNIDDVNLEEGYVTCKTGNKQRTIPLGTMSLNALKEYVDDARDVLIKNDDEKALFVNVNGGRLTRQGFWKIIKYYKEQAHITKRYNTTCIKTFICNTFITKWCRFKSYSNNAWTF